MELLEKAYGGRDEAGAAEMEFYKKWCVPACLPACLRVGQEWPRWHVPPRRQLPRGMWLADNGA